MKSIILSVLVIAMIFGFTGCAATFKEMGKGIQTEVGGGLQRKITMYSYDGKEIRSWQGNIIIQQSGNGETEFLIDGKKIAISGIFAVEEL